VLDGRSFLIEEKGFRILRFKNEEVINNVKDVLDRILKI
jgi:very-short-patch-repair endonuclease